MVEERSRQGYGVEDESTRGLEIVDGDEVAHRSAYEEDRKRPIDEEPIADEDEINPEASTYGAP